MRIVVARPSEHGLSERCLPGPRLRSDTHKHAFLAAVLVTLGSLLSGCTIDGFGFALSKVTQAKGAVVIDTETFGAALSTGAADSGLAVGYTNTLLVLPEGPDRPHPGSYLFGVSASRLPAVASIRRVIGIDINTNRHAVGVMLGLSETATLAEVNRGSSTARSLVLTPDDPANVMLRAWCEPPCE